MLAGPEWAYWLFALVLGLLAIIFFALCHFLATKEEAKRRAGRVLIFGAALLALGPLVGLIGRLVLYLSQLGTSPVP
jgi:phosphoglycerol transferase MdoB-like AlkP superfamily enzyme